MTRQETIATFLDDLGLGGWRRVPLAGDASARRYERLHNPEGGSLILMDADPIVCGDPGPFLDIRTHLYRFGFSAPTLHAEDPDAGLLLIEDFGDALFARIMADDPSREMHLYTLAAELLARLHSKPLPQGMTAMTATALADMIAPAFDCYAPKHLADLPAAKAAFARLLTPVADVPAVLALRDFHAENMIFLPDRNGDRQIGLLDFQDAFVTHPAYDLVSMLQDARRDLTPGIADSVLRHFIAKTGADDAAFRTAYAALGAQRNLRILGVFARLAADRGKPQYLALQPRVWAHLQTSLTHPALADVRDALANLPAPQAVT